MSAKPFLSLILICFLFISCEKEKIWPQLLSDSDIENSTSNAWMRHSFGDTSYGFSRTLSESYSPTHSLFISKSTKTTGSAGYWYQQYSGDIPVGKDLVVTAKIKGNNIDGPGALISIRADSISNQYSSSQFATTFNSVEINGSFDWETYSLRLENIKPNIECIYVFLVLYSETTGDVFFDDITLNVE